MTHFTTLITSVDKMNMKTSGLILDSRGPVHDRQAIDIRQRITGRIPAIDVLSRIHA